jgi:apolipoprotein D and lipocalin family protein
MAPLRSVALLLSVALSSSRARRIHSSLAQKLKQSDCPAVETQPDFNLTSYISKRWYVQEQMVMKYSPVDSFNCVTAKYSMKEKPTRFNRYTITVENSAKYDDGRPLGGELCAYAADKADPAKLGVAPCILPKRLSGPYWVLAYDEEEGYALISGGQPTIEAKEGCQTGTGNYNSGLWILTREALASEALVAKVRQIAKQQGFDVSVLKRVKHEGCTGEGYGKSEKSGCPAVKTQPDFNLTSYISKRWYAQEQMVIKYLQADSFNCVTAKYSLKKKPTWFNRYTITVKNSAEYDDGKPMKAELCAYAADKADPAKLAVAPCFLPKWLSGPYWVLAYDEAEGYALISGCQPTVETEEGCQTGTGTNKSGLWIFTREAKASEALVAKVRQIAKQQGFDVSVLKPVKQEGCTGEGYE